MTVIEECMNFARSSPVPGSVTTCVDGTIYKLEDGAAVRQERLLFLPDCLGISPEKQADEFLKNLRGSAANLEVIMLPPINEGTPSTGAFWFSRGKIQKAASRKKAYRQQILTAVVEVLRYIAECRCSVVAGLGQGGFIALALPSLFNEAVSKVRAPEGERAELKDALAGVRRIIAVRPGTAKRAALSEIQEAIKEMSPFEQTQRSFPVEGSIVLDKFCPSYSEVKEVEGIFQVPIWRVPQARVFPLVPLEPQDIMAEQDNEEIVPLEPHQGLVGMSGRLREQLHSAQRECFHSLRLIKTLTKEIPISPDFQRDFLNKERFYRVSNVDGVLERNVGKGVWVPEVPNVKCPLTFERTEIAEGALKSVTTSTWRHYLLFLIHNSLEGGHRSAEQLYPRVRTLVYWPKLESDLHHWADQICLPCSRRRRAGRIGYFKMRKLRGGPFRWVQMDLVGPISPAGIGTGGVKCRYILTYICVFTKFVYFRPITSKDSRDVAEAVLQIFFESGSWPLVIQSDNGKEFVNWVLAEVLRLSSICHVRGSSYTPRIQGIIESQHKSLGAGLCILVCEFLNRFPAQWPSLLPALQYHSRIKPLFGKTSAHELVHGWKGVSPLEASLMPTGEVSPGAEFEGEWLSELVENLKDLHTWFTAISNEEQEVLRQRHDARVFPVRVAVGDNVVVEKPIFDQERSSKLINRAVGVGIVTLVADDQHSVAVRYSDGTVEKRVATSRLIAFPFVLRHDLGSDPEYEVRGTPITTEAARALRPGVFVVFGIASPRGDESILVGLIDKVEPSEARVSVHEYGDKGTGPVGMRRWNPMYFQKDARIGTRVSGDPIVCPVPFSRIYASFPKFAANQRIPQATIDELAQERGVILVVGEE